MTNLVEITVKASNDTAAGFAKAKADAAKAGAEAGKAYSDAFDSAVKLKAGGVKGGSSKDAGGLLGSDPTLLKRLESQAMQPGGIGIIGTGTDRTLQNMLRSALSSGKMGLLGDTEDTKSAIGGLTNAVTNGNTTTTNTIRQVLAGNGATNTSTTDTIKQILSGNSPGNTSTTDFIKQVVEGTKPGDISTKDVIHPTVDDKDIQDLGKQDGDTYGNGFMSSLKKIFSSGGKGGISSLLTGSSSGGGGSGSILGDIASANPGGVAGGILPGISGVSAGLASLAGVGAALLAALPAVVALGAGLGTIAAGFAVLYETDSKFKDAVTSTFNTMKSVVTDAVKPLAGPLTSAMQQLGGFVKSIGPGLTQVFAAAGPLVEPLVKGLEGFVSGVGPGFLAIVKAAGPAMSVFASVLGTLGRDLGTSFGMFATVIGPSSLVLKSLMNAISALFPIVAQFASVFATELGPLFKTFSSSLNGMMPAITAIARVIGDFAAAVLGALGSALGAVGALLKAITPALNTLANALGNVFNTMENAGTFAILGDAVEALVKPLGVFIDLLVQQLAPLLPAIMSLVSKLANVLTTLLVAGLSAILTGLTAVLKAFPMLVPILGAVGAAWLAMNAIMALNPFVAIGIALVALVGVIVKYHAQIISVIETAWNTIESFIKTAWNDIMSFAEQWWPLLLGPAGLILKYHTQVEAGIKTAWNDILSFLKGLWGDIETAATAAWSAVSSGVTTAWNAIVSFFKSIPGKITTAVGDAGNVLLSWGKSVISGLLTGMEDIWSSVESFISSIPSKILNFLGIHSPPDWAISAGKEIMNGLGIGMSQAQNAAAKGTAAFQASIAKVAALPALSGGGGSVQSLMQSMAAAKGWTGAQWNALYDVEMREAGFNLNAQNPSSGAYGLAQFINGPSEYASYGGNSSTAAGQITAMLNYIAQRYGTPAAAWQHELNYGWYDQGGWLPTGKSIAVNNTGRPEMVVGPNGMNITLTVDSSGQGGFDDFMSTWIKNYVRIKGGGNTQKAFGRT